MKQTVLFKIYYIGGRNIKTKAEDEAFIYLKNKSSTRDETADVLT